MNLKTGIRLHIEMYSQMGMSLGRSVAAKLGTGLRRRHTQIPVVLSICLLSLGAVSSVEAAEFQRVHMAGSFNNWATGDSGFALMAEGGRWQVERFWESGTYEFKFVFDGTWAKHLGAAGADRLAQPGQNISLVIPRSGEYVVWLNPEEKRWGLEPVVSAQPTPVVGVANANSSSVELAALNLGEATPKLKWTVRRLDAKEKYGSLSTKSPASTKRPILQLKSRGRYEIHVVADYGKLKREGRFVGELGPGYQFRANPKSEGEGFAKRMQPLGHGQWGVLWKVAKKGSYAISVASGHRPEAGATPAKGAAPTERVLQNVEPGDWLVVFDPATDSLAIHRDGWHEFVYVPESGELPVGLSPETIERVELVGDFNQWSAGVDALGRESFDPPRFSGIVRLPDGLHAYKLLINGCVWLEDPKADRALRSADGSGVHHSGVRVGPYPATFGSPQSNHIACGAVGHDSSRSEYFQPIGKDLVRLTVRTLQDDVEGVSVGIERVFGNLPLMKSESRAGFDYWSATCRIEPSNVSYTFTLRDGTARCLLDSSRCQKLPPVGGEPFSVQTAPFEIEVRMSFETPDWAKRVVWYQIFPERFCNGEPANDPPRTVPWTHKWFEPYDGTKERGQGAEGPRSRGKDDSSRRFKEKGGFHEYIYDRRYGGDLQGVREKLPYLRELGITAIYFNPIFLAESLHKYDASDFRHIDDFFGVRDSLKKIKGETMDPATWQWSESDKVFLDFLQEAHRQGFKVIIDGVFNHVGRDFWAFQDVLEHGKKSRYAGWFDITSWEPFHYMAWDRDDGSLPRLKHDDALGLAEEVREHLFAVTRRWMDPNGDGDPSDGIDGWRLDVASDINANFWRDWRALVKQINPDAYIVAELWEESKVWLDGRTFDAVMNYPFARAGQRFIVNVKKRSKPSELEHDLKAMLGWYPPQVNYVLQNLYDSHDTDRLASMFMNPDLEYDQANRLQDNGPDYNPDKPTRECYERQKLAATFQMTFLGAPMIYYGDEVGMYGADDPSCRKPMLWPELMPYDDPEEKIEQDVLEHYRRVIAIRNTYPALQIGSFDPLAAVDDKGVFAFARTLDGESVVVILNSSGHRHRLDVPSPWPDGTKIVRLDDPKESEMIMPSPDDPRARPTVRPKSVKHEHVRVEGGHLRGLMLHPYEGAVLARVDP